MAIGFARLTPIQRARGHSVVERFAYVTRTKLVSTRTGQTFDSADQEGLHVSKTILPSGTSLPGGTDAELWQAVEKASKRRDAVLGSELVLALPAPTELPIELSCVMVERFARRIIVDKHSLPVTLSIHEPQESQGQIYPTMASEPVEFSQALANNGLNVHAHLLIAPRQLTDEGFSRRRYTTLDAVNRGSKVFGRHWGRLWHQFQNEFFAEIGSDLRVTSNAPVSLSTVSLSEVRRWRKHLLNADPAIDGRRLLVNAEREEQNQKILENLDGAMTCFHAPFTRSELERFYTRHLDRETASELVSANIGLGTCVELVVPESSGEWFASVNQVHQELAVFGRALILSNRQCGRCDVSASLMDGYTSETRDVLIKAFSGPDLVLVKTQGNASVLSQEIAQTAESHGLIPVAVANAACHSTPKAVVRDIQALRARMVSNAVIIVDDVDCLTPGELSSILAVGVRGNNKVILIQRGDTDWPTLELVGLIAKHCRSCSGQA